MLKGFIIDVGLRTIVEVETTGELAEIQAAVGVSIVTVADIDNINCVYIDDNGLFVPNQEFFTINGMPLAGNGLVIGTGREGESISSTLDLEDLNIMVTFKTLEQMRNGEYDDQYK